SRQRRADARVVGHRAVAQRHVEVDADQHALLAQVHVGHLEHRHVGTSAANARAHRPAPGARGADYAATFFAPASAAVFMRATVVSSMRLLKPHSLSYHEQTFTSVPSETLVSVASKIEDAGLWLKSTDTSGPSLYSRMPLRSLAAASRIALFTSSTEVGRFATKERSTTETLMVGTRIAKPSSLPLRCGSTSPTAAAAPVLVGIIDCVAERARRRSSW